MNASVLLLTMFMAVTMIDPSNQLLGAKEVLFSLVFIVYGLRSIGKGIDRFSLVFLGFVFALMLPAGILAGNAPGMDVPMVMLYLKAFLFLLLLPFARLFSKEFAQAFRWAGYVFMIVYGILVLDYAILGLGLGKPFVESQNIKLGSRTYGTLRLFSAFHKGSPLLLVLEGIFLYRALDQKRSKAWIGALLCALLLLFSATRANLLAGFALLLVGVYLSLPKRWRFWAMLGGIALAFLPLASFFLDTFLSVDRSINVKNGHLESYLVLFSQQPEIWLHGLGMGQGFYSSGFGEFTQVTELVYLDMIRVWGLPVSLIFVALAAEPLWKCRSPAIIRFACLGYLLIAGTNPLLLSSTGFLAIEVLHSLAQPGEVNELQ